MDSRVTRRAVGDIRAVCHSTSPVAATRWMTSLLMNLPECVRNRSLSPADRAWAHSGASFTAPDGSVIFLPASHSQGAREMYCMNVYLRSGLTMPPKGWVVDLEANRGLFSVWAAVAGAEVVAVEAQQGFSSLIMDLANRRSVAERVHVEITMDGRVAAPGAEVGIAGDDQQWRTMSHSAPTRPHDISMPEIMSKYRIYEIGLLKVDIEGGEFAVLGYDDALDWLEQVDEITLEVHTDFGDTPSRIERLQAHGFYIDLRDNDGYRAEASSSQLNYVYRQRPPKRRSYSR
jgi:FkbM family methyltransferase